MDLEKKFKKETGFDAYADNDLRPKVPSDYYVEWLEEQLTLTDVSERKLPHWARPLIAIVTMSLSTLFVIYRVFYVC